MDLWRRRWTHCSTLSNTGFFAKGYPHIEIYKERKTFGEKSLLCGEDDGGDSMPHGKQPNHKLKPYVVFQYLLKYTDENHVAPASDIVAFLEECGLNAERRSIYEDIREINLISIMMENDCTLDEAREMLEDEEEKLVVYDPHRKGFYVRQRHFDLNDIRLLAECVYSAKFVTEGQAKRLVDVVCDFVSEHQAERIKHNAFLTDRVKTNNRSVLNNISVINDAMSRRLEGKSHKPEKISFKYLKHTIDDMTQQVERRKGEKYTVSPYQLLISDGNYYLLAYVNEKQKMRTYRIDRMKDVSLTGEPREGEDEFAKLDVRTYAQRVFGMYSGTQKRVTIQFINPLLDTAIERFGMKDVQYSKVDDRHFKVTANVEISDQFYGWLLGFGKRAKLTWPDDEVEKFRLYVEKIEKMYNNGGNEK